MQTLEQILGRIDELFLDVYPSLQKELKQLIRSGAVDLESADDNFRLPKILLSAALLRVAAQYEPLNPDDKKLMRNLKFF